MKTIEEKINKEPTVSVRTVRIENKVWEKVEAVAMALSHELESNITPSDIIRQAVDELLKKWED